MTPAEYIQLKAFARQDGALLFLLWIASFACYIIGISSPLYATVALVLMVIAVALACTWSLWRSPADAVLSPGTNAQGPQGAEPSAPPEPTPQPEGAQTGPQADAKAGASKVSTIVYYQDNYGYLVPVMCSVPMEDGIAKATLNLMVQSVGNDMQAARLGLRTVLPENTKIDLDISNGLARIDLSREVLDMADAAAEAVAVEAVAASEAEEVASAVVALAEDGKTLSASKVNTEKSHHVKKNKKNIRKSFQVTFFSVSL